MRLAHTVVNVLVFGFAAIFAVFGVRLLLVALGQGPATLEPGDAVGKALLGLVFLLAAAPMVYYVFARGVRGVTAGHLAVKKHTEGRPPAP